MELTIRLIDQQIKFLYNSIDLFLTKNKISQEQRQGAEAYRDYMVEEFEAMKAKLESK